MRWIPLPVFLKDRKWKAELPILTTHFQLSDDNVVVPNAGGLVTTINLFDLFDSKFITNHAIIRHMEDLKYPHTRGSKVLIELEQFKNVGDDAHATKEVEKWIKDTAQSHSSVLNSSRDSRRCVLLHFVIST